MIKLVLSDMDDTIVPIGTGGVSERMRAAVYACLDAGVRFASATGRDPDGLDASSGETPPAMPLCSLSTARSSRSTGA